MNIPIQPEDFGVADSEYLHNLGFTDAEINKGIYSEQVSNGTIMPNGLGAIRSF